MAVERVVALALWMLLFAGSTAAQDQPPLIPVRIGSEFGFRDPDDPERHVIVALGGVELQQGKRRMLADTLVLVLASGDDALAGLAPNLPSGRFIEAFLDGNVTIEEDDEVVIGAQSLLIDGASGKLTILDGSWRTTLEQETVVIRFELMRQLRDGTHEFEHLTYTTCDYAHAHWGIDTPWAVLVPSPEGRILKTSFNTGWVAGVPLAVAPGLHFNIDRDRPPLRHVRIGRSREFGTEIETLWGGDASEFMSHFADTMLGVDVPVEGEWEVELDNYSSRGVFLQPEWRWSTGPSHGRLTMATIHDRNDEDYLPTREAAGLDNRIEDNSRGRVEFEQRTRIDEHRTVDVELSSLSDRGFLEEYYEDESRVDKPPETYAYYRDAEDNRAFTVLAKGRLNDFLDVIEYLPQVERRRLGEPLGWLGGGFVTSRDIAGWARHRNEAPRKGTVTPPLPAPTHDRSSEALRLGTNRRIDWTFDAGPDRVVVTAGIDLTALSQRFQDDLSTPAVMETASGTFLRRAFIGGVRWSQTWSGSREAHSDTWNIDGLRHIIEPSVSFDSVLGLNRRPHLESTTPHGGGELIPIDDIEALDKRQRFVVGVRHRLQTHQGDRQVTLLDTEVFMPLYPNERRDNPNAPETYGYVVIDSTWTPGADLWGLRTGAFEWKAVLDPNDSMAAVKSRASYRATIGEGRSIQISDSKARSSSHTRTYGAEWVLAPRWSGAVFLQQDVFNNRTAAEGLILRQRAHKWIIDIEFRVRRGTDRISGANRDDRRLKISFQPSAFSDASESILDRLGRIRR